MSRRTWLLWFLALAVAVFVAVDHYTGYEAVGAATRFLWNGAVFLVNSLWRASGEFVAAIARAVGMRRVARVTAGLAGVGLGYAGSVILSDEKIHQAHTWRDKLRVVVTRIRNWWVGLHLVWKLAIVAALIASQVYLHFLLIVFPIAFLVPVVRRAWILMGDTFFGELYQKKMQRVNKALRRVLWRTPGYPQLVSTARLIRMRYLCAWRRWRYDACYRKDDAGARHVSLLEPVRLWWRGELDRYVERPLLAGQSPLPPEERLRRPPAKARDVAPAPKVKRMVKPKRAGRGGTPPTRQDGARGRDRTGTTE